MNGKVNKTPVVIQYSYFGKDRIATGVKYRFKAYETIYTDGTVHHWDDVHPIGQMDYRILHQLMIQNAATSGPGK